MNAQRSLIWTTLCWTAIPLLLVLVDGALTHAARSIHLGPDDMLLGWMNDHRTPFFDCFFLANTWIGSLFILFPLTGVLAVMLFLRNRRMDACLLAVGLGGAALVTQIAKLIFTRPRPELFDSLITMPTSWSFPSGHTTQITAFSLCLGIVVLRSSTPSWIFWSVVMIAVILTISVGISRLYLQLHYPTDVLTGAAVAILWVGGLFYSLLNWNKETCAVI